MSRGGAWSIKSRAWDLLPQKERKEEIGCQEETWNGYWVLPARLLLFPDFFCFPSRITASKLSPSSTWRNYSLMFCSLPVVRVSLLNLTIYELVSCGSVAHQIRVSVHTKTNDEGACAHDALRKPKHTRTWPTEIVQTCQRVNGQISAAERPMCYPTPQVEGTTESLFRSSAIVLSLHSKGTNFVNDNLRRAMTARIGTPSKRNYIVSKCSFSRFQKHSSSSGPPEYAAQTRSAVVFGNRGFRGFRLAIRVCVSLWGSVFFPVLLFFSPCPFACFPVVSLRRSSLVSSGSSRCVSPIHVLATMSRDSSTLSHVLAFPTST